MYVLDFLAYIFKIIFDFYFLDPSDFTPQQLSISVQPFSSGMPQFCSPLSIIDDSEAEQDETIALALLPMPSSRIVPAQNSMYTLIIKGRFLILYSQNFSRILKF